MAERPMTPDEMQDFENDVLHHRDEEPDAAGPASDPDVAQQLDRDDVPSTPAIIRSAD